MRRVLAGSCPRRSGSDCQNDRSLLAPTAGLIPCSPDAAFARRDPKRNALPNLSSSAEREGASGSSATCRSRSARSSTRAARSNTLATRRKLVAGRFTWQTTSTTPAVIESPWGSTIASTGVTLRGYGPYYQRREVGIRPFTVRRCANVGPYPPAACPSSDGADGGKAASAASICFCTAFSKTRCHMAATKLSAAFRGQGDATSWPRPAGHTPHGWTIACRSSCHSDCTRRGLCRGSFESLPRRLR